MPSFSSLWMPAAEWVPQEVVVKGRAQGEAEGPLLKGAPEDIADSEDFWAPSQLSSSMTVGSKLL